MSSTLNGCMRIAFDAREQEIHTTRHCVERENSHKSPRTDGKSAAVNCVLPRLAFPSNRGRGKKHTSLAYELPSTHTYVVSALN